MEQLERSIRRTVEGKEKRKSFREDRTRTGQEGALRRLWRRRKQRALTSRRCRVDWKGTDRQRKCIPRPRNR